MGPKIEWKLLCIFHSIPFDRARDSVLFVETASVVTGTFLTAQSASLYSDSVMNWCCDCQPCLTLTVHNLHQTLYTIICQPCLTLTTQCASDSLHCHLSAMSDTDCTQSASDSLHCHLSAMLTLHNLHLTLYTVICPSCQTLTVHNLHLTLYTVMNWCWDRPPCLTLTVHPLAFRFVGRPGKYKTIFGARQEEVSVCVVLGVLVLVITCVVNPPWSELVGAVHAQRTYLHTCT